MTDYIADLRDTVDRVAAELLEIDADAAARRPRPGAWPLN